MSDTNDQPGNETGLLESASVESENQAAQPEKTQIEHRAATPGAEIPGTPKVKPEFLPDNFWDTDKGEANYEAMAKSWSDLRKMISQGKHKAPDGGKYDTSMLKTQDLENDPLAKGYMSWAAKWGISQGAFDELATQFSEIAEGMAPPPVDPAAELKQLGPNGQAVVNGMVDWARGLVNKGVWSKDDFEEFKIMGGTARGLRALMKIRESYEGRVPIETAPMEGALSKEELYQMVGDPKYKTDAAYRQKVEKLFQTHLS